MPPCLRVVDMSACVNGWNSFAACSGVMPMPVSRTENLSCTFSPVRSSSSMFKPDLAALGELDGVVDEVRQDLAEAERVAAAVARESRERHRTRNSSPLSCAFWAVSVVTELITSSSWKSVVSMSSLPASIFEKSRMSLMMRQQRRAGVVDLADVVALLGIERGLEREVREADDGVHRRADLVAHVGEELALGLGGVLGLLLGSDEVQSQAV